MSEASERAITRLLEDIKREKERLIVRRRMVTSLLPIEEILDRFPEGYWDHYIGIEYNFELPMRFELVEQFKEFIKEKGWMHTDIRQYVWDDKDAGQFITVYMGQHYSDTSFEVSFRTTKAGATCIIQKIGEEMKPVFEMVCSEGASEPILQKG